MQKEMLESWLHGQAPGTHVAHWHIWHMARHAYTYTFKNAERTVSLGVALENLGQRLFPKKKKTTHTKANSHVSYFLHEGQSGSAVRDGPSKPARKIPFPAPERDLSLWKNTGSPLSTKQVTNESLGDFSPQAPFNLIERLSYIGGGESHVEILKIRSF